MAQCPFYGCRWPERSPILRRGRANECGLDVEQNRACRMEVEGRAANYFCCPLVQSKGALLNVGAGLIWLPDVDGKLITLREWKERGPR